MTEEDWIIVFGRKVGTIVGKTLMCRRHSKKHFFRKYKGYGLSVAAINQARERGAEQAQIDVIDTNESYLASFEDFLEKGHTWGDQGGHDKQKILPLTKFKKI